jgi:DNA-binding HxlR family transcriptional regulator
MATVRKLDALDDVIHQKVRLGVMSSLMAAGEADFNFLKAALGVSDGNLSTHLAVLEEHGYILVRKEFVGKKPRTTYTPTPAGRKAFESYVAALESLVRT